MELSSLAALIGSDIAALGRLGDDATADAATRIVGALGGPINARLVLIAETGDDEPPAAAPADGDTDARITLRLPAALKVALEAAATAEGVSVNSYIIRRLSAQPSQSTRPQQYGRRRMSGYGRS